MRASSSLVSGVMLYDEQSCFAAFSWEWEERVRLAELMNFCAMPGLRSSRPEYARMFA
jgi:hypothetical protein